MVGSDIIDNQHKVLFDLIKDLNNAIRTEVSIRVVDVLLGVLRDYAFQHFQTEEELLKNHVDNTLHCLEHYRLIKQLNTFIHDFRNNRTNGEPTPSSILEHWLVEHIEQFDKPFVSFRQACLSRWYCMCYDVAGLFCPCFNSTGWYTAILFVIPRHPAVRMSEKVSAVSL